MAISESCDYVFVVRMRSGLKGRAMFVDVRHRLFSGLKGHFMSAQGNALGSRFNKMKSPERVQQMFCLHAEWIDRFQLVETLRCPFRAIHKCVRVTWGGVHPHSRIHLPQADMLCPVGAKRNCPSLSGPHRLDSGLQAHGISAFRLERPRLSVFRPERPRHVCISA